MNFKLDEIDNELLNEISAISGFSKVQIQEVWEYTIVSIFETILKGLENKESEFKINIPLLGEVTSKYLGEDDGGDIRISMFNNTLVFSSLFQELVGGAIDGNVDKIEELFKSKLKESIVHCLNN